MGARRKGKLWAQGALTAARSLVGSDKHVEPVYGWRIRGRGNSIGESVVLGISWDDALQILERNLLAECDAKNKRKYGGPQ